MGAQTATGAGAGSAANIKPLILNGVVKSFNYAPSSIDERPLVKAPVIVTDDTLTLTADSHAFRTVVLKRAAGITVTLPAATGTGNKYVLTLGATVTSNTVVIQVANASDSFVGRSLGCADGGNTVNGWEVSTGDDTITLNGGTKGGYLGDTFEFIDFADNTFLVNGFQNQTGVEATPFSAAVS